MWIILHSNVLNLYTKFILKIRKFCKIHYAYLANKPSWIVYFGQYNGTVVHVARSTPDTIFKFLTHNHFWQTCGLWLLFVNNYVTCARAPVRFVRQTMRGESGAWCMNTKTDATRRPRIIFIPPFFYIYDKFRPLLSLYYLWLHRNTIFAVSLWMRLYETKTTSAGALGQSSISTHSQINNYHVHTSSNTGGMKFYPEPMIQHAPTSCRANSFRLYMYLFTAFDIRDSPRYNNARPAVVLRINIFVNCSTLTMRKMLT